MARSMLSLILVAFLFLEAVCERETESGCPCQEKWVLADARDKPCEDYCCNPDDDPRGEWCKVTFEVSNMRCWLQSWGYCKSNTPTPAPAPTAKDEFVQFEQGACRGVTPDHSPHSWFRRMNVSSSEECFQECLNDTACYAVEMYIEHQEPWGPVESSSQYCEHWNREPLSTGVNLIYSSGSGGGYLKACFKKESLISQTLHYATAPHAYTAHLNQVCPEDQLSRVFTMEPEICRELCTEAMDCTSYALKQSTHMWATQTCVFGTGCVKADLLAANETGWITFTKEAEDILVPTDSLQLAAQNNFTRFQSGPCRGFKPDHNPESWYVVLPSADPQTCFQSCLDDMDCKAVEVLVAWDGEPNGSHCELWSHEPNATGFDAPQDDYHRRACFKKSYMPGGVRPDFDPSSQMYSSHANMICEKRDDLGVHVRSLQECSEACTENQNCISYAFKSWNWCELSGTCKKQNLVPTAMVGWTTYVKTSDSSELPKVEVAFPAFTDFEQFQTGACRGDKFDHNPTDWYSVEENTGPEECFESCNGNPACVAVEIQTNAVGYPVGDHCEIWTHAPQSTSHDNPLLKNQDDLESLYPGNIFPTCYKRKNAVDGDRPVLDTSKPAFSAHPKMSCKGKGDLGVSHTYSKLVCQELCIENSKCLSFTYVETWREKKCVMSSTCTKGLLTAVDPDESATTYVKFSLATAMTSRAKTLWQSKFSQFQEGPCRGHSEEHNPPTWYSAIANEGGPENCFNACQADSNCKAVEVYTRQSDGDPVGNLCEHWTHEPRATGAPYRYGLNLVKTCFKINDARDPMPGESVFDASWSAYLSYPKKWCPGMNELGNYEGFDFDQCKYMCTEDRDCVAFEWLQGGTPQRCQLSTSCIESELRMVTSGEDWATYLKAPEPTTTTVTTTTTSATTVTTSATTTTTTATKTTTLTTPTTTVTTTTATTTTSDGALMLLSQRQRQEIAASQGLSPDGAPPPSSTTESEGIPTIMFILVAGIGFLILLVCCLGGLFLRSRRQLMKQARDAQPMNPNYDVVRTESNLSSGSAVVIGSPVTDRTLSNGVLSNDKADGFEAEKAASGVAIGPATNQTKASSSTDPEGRDRGLSSASTASGPSGGSREEQAREQRSADERMENGEADVPPQMRGFHEEQAPEHGVEIREL